MEKLYDLTLKIEPFTKEEYDILIEFVIDGVEEFRIAGLTEEEFNVIRRFVTMGSQKLIAERMKKLYKKD